MFKLAMDCLPKQRDLYSQPTTSYLKNTPDARVEMLKRYARLHLPKVTPDHAIFSNAVLRMTRLVI